MSAAESPCPVALVGMGRRGWAHLEMLLAMPGRIQLVAVCDRDPAILRKARELAGPDVVAAQRVEDLLAACQPEFAVVSTMQDTLPAVSCELLEDGVAVLTEVPPAYDGRAIRGMIETAGRNGVALGSSENYTRIPIERLKQRLLRSGALGRLERADVSGSVGHKGHEMALARHYVGVEARPTRARATGSKETGLFSGEGVQIPHRLSGTVEFDNGTEANFGLRAVKVDSKADLDSADLRSDFHASGGGCRENRFYLMRDGQEQSVSVEADLVDVGGVPVPRSLRLGGVPDVVWTNPFVDTAFPPASRREYLCRVDDTPQSWEIAMADAYVDMAQAVRENRAPEYEVAHSLTDVRIRLMMIESSRRGGEWVDWQEAEPFPVERQIIQRGWLRTTMRHPWTGHVLALRRRILRRGA